MNVLGADVGSTMAKFVLINDIGDILFSYSSKILGDPISCVEQCIKLIQNKFQYSHLAVTGSSRSLVASFFQAELTKSEILAHMHGVTHFVKSPDVIFEIGGQDSKCVVLKNGVISEFFMNSSCAAGTGAFIEAQARRLGVSIVELNNLAMNASKPVVLNSKCAVFLESSLIELQRNGERKENIAMAIFMSLAKNYIENVAQSVTFHQGDVIVFVGGVAKLDAMRHALEQILKMKLLVPSLCEYTGALGVALTLLHDDMGELNCDNNGIIIKQCTGCINRCLLNGLQTDTGIIYYGGLCGKYQFT